jgi:excisionase family DNA binding protein
LTHPYFEYKNATKLIKYGGDIKMDYPVTFTVKYPDRLSRGLVILKVLFGWLYIGIPHGIILYFYGIAVSIVVFLAFSVSEVSELLGLSRSATYKLIRTSQIPSIKFGKRILVPRVKLEMMLS